MDNLITSLHYNELWQGMKGDFLFSALMVIMLCLSKTRKISGSYWSSFSETAASIGNIELIVVRKK